MADTVEKSEKVDKGSCFIYWKLSYRRKFIRTLWMMPIAVVATAILFILEPFIAFGIINSHILGVLVISVSVIQLAYNYIRWKRETPRNG